MLMAVAPSALYAKYTTPTEITVPSTYTNTVTLSGSASITGQTTPTAYRLTGDVTSSPSGVSLSDANLWFTSDSADNLANLAFTRPSGSSKAAFYVGSPLVAFDSLNEVSFTSFAANSTLGGAVNVYASGNLSFNNNAKVSFENNKAYQTNNNSVAYGGAISADGIVDFQNNKEIVFDSNEVHSQGGAISSRERRTATTTISLKFHENDNISFTNNSTSNKLAGLGGAIFNLLDNMELTHNGTLTFQNNTAKATTIAQGGAIHSHNNGGAAILSNDISYNDSVSFTKNKAQSSSSSERAQGGAIMSLGTDLLLNSNGTLSFTNNLAHNSNSSGIVSGGAIHAEGGGSLSIQNNGSVIFQDNKTQRGNTVKYNSIYASDSNEKKIDVAFSAPEDGSIEFRDSIYVDASQHTSSSFNLNSKYTDENGKEIAQTGEIIFTGAYMTEGDKTSEFKGVATLHDGKLVVKEGAVLKAGELEVEQSASGKSTPTVVVDSATLQADKLSFANASRLEYMEVDNATKAQISISESLTLGNNMTVLLGLSGSFSGDTLKVAVAEYIGSNSSWYNLPTDTTFKVDSLSWTATGLEWKVENNVLYVEGTATQLENVVIDDKDVVLEDENGLGSGGVVVEEGESSITTDDGVTAILPGTIQNKGELTMGGSYDASSLTHFELEETRIDVKGEEGNNGFHRESATAVLVVDNLVVDNQGKATLTVEDGTVVTGKEGDMKLQANGLATNAEVDYSNYYIEEENHVASMSDIQDMRPDKNAELTITMKDGNLIADEDAKNVVSTGGTISTEGDVTVGGEGKISGTTKVLVHKGSTTTLAGENDYTGDTIISGKDSTLKVKNGKALGHSKVHLHNEAKLDLNKQALSNYINVTGCELHNASSYTGNLDVSGNLRICGTDATANKVTFTDDGHITPSAGETLTLNTVDVSTSANYPYQLGIDTSVKESIVLRGTVLTMGEGATLTLAPGTIIVLRDAAYNKGDILIEGAKGGDIVLAADGKVTMQYGYGVYTKDGNNVVLGGVFYQPLADVFTVNNWGMATASRAFVNAVRGQRNNTACLADGKGTVWFTLLGANHDIAGSEIELQGAALGADMKVGKRSVLGIATGYVEGELRPSGMMHRPDSESSYIAVYGEHGLKKLSSASCLTLDWVAAYGTTETKFGSFDLEQDSLQINTRLSWNKKVNDRLCVRAFGGLEYFANGSDTVDGKKTGSIQNLRAEIGVGASYVAWGAAGVTNAKSGVMSGGCNKLVLHGELRYMNDMVRSNPVIVQDGLRGSGANPGRHGMGVEVGATYRIGERWSASANYGFNTMDDSREHRANIGAAYTF